MGLYGDLMGFMVTWWEWMGSLMGFAGIYSLVNVYVAVENHIVLVGKSTINNFINGNFHNSYVKLPEGNPWDFGVPYVQTIRKEMNGRC